MKMLPQLRHFLYQNRVITRPLAWVVSPKSYKAVNKRDSGASSDSVQQNSCGCYETSLFSFITSLGHRNLNSDFKIPSMLSCFSIWLLLNEMQYKKLSASESDRLFCHRPQAENFDRNDFSYYGERSRPFHVGNCISLQTGSTRNIFTNRLHSPRFKTWDTFSMATRNISSKAGKIVIREKESWEMFVNYEKLTPLEKRIHERHKDAVQKNEEKYIDPQTGYQVMTRVAHLNRGECCGNACRHCPYGQENVPVEKRKKFNTAFYI